MGERDLVITDGLGEPQAGEVLALAEAATRRDGVAPLSEQSLLTLRAGRAHALLVLEDGAVAAYAHVDPVPEEDGGGASGELVVHPDRRGRGHGRALLRALREEARGPLRVWAHGDLPAAAALAGSEGLRRVRVLLQMRRPFDGTPLPEVTVPDGVQIRAFEVGRDEDAWLRVNGRAFADHPEQGAWTLEDVRARQNEPWFDPAGLFLAERDGQVIGFHWTKVHPEPVGEVYVVGVDPSAQGLGLGRVLTLVGLHHLRERGLPAVMLYVDEANRPAVRLYESLGFTRHAVDVMYGAPPVA
ncbi:mycothiol synthase [Thermomonospora echinospora]|uniref:Mycothiol acetyltransferase n=1 Tax=Thermomonospora echinospora TaxID=1992 RepID=A0A1H6D1I2_9ACTN|nr:mycothiol synthase [Thermomonospora echinospora]SEG79239.1 mycothiol synthase [Thermomonospora echinospora]